MNKQRWTVGLLAGIALSALGSVASASTGSVAAVGGYTTKCHAIWKSVPYGGAVPDRPKYTIQGYRCVGVPNRPGYLDKPRKEVHVYPPRKVGPEQPDYLKKPRIPDRVKIRPNFGDRSSDRRFGRRFDTPGFRHRIVRPGAAFRRVPRR